MLMMLIKPLFIICLHAIPEILSYFWYKANVLGPEFPPVSRVQNQYLKNIMLKIPSNQSLAKTKNCIGRIEKSINVISRYMGVRIIYNVYYL